jgi:hypothetical protein
MLARDYGLSAEQLWFRRLCRDFVEKKILQWVRAFRDRVWNAGIHAGPEPVFRPDGTASAGSVGQRGGS